MKKPSFSFPRDRILKKADNFKELYREGICLRGKAITLFYRPAETFPFRVGFSTRKKLGSAVVRNRARRLMREVFRLHQHGIKKGIQYLFLWTGPVKGVNFQAAEQEMLHLLKRGDLIQTELK